MVKWLEWFGDDCPVPPETTVTVKLRDFQYPIAVDGEITIRSTHAAPESLLPAIKLAAKVLVAHWWLNRVPVATNTASMPLPYTFEAIVNPVKVGVYAW